VIIKKWNTAHWNRHIETNRMVVVSSFYGHWMLRNLIKIMFNILLNNLVFSDHKWMKLLPFDSSLWDDSNELCFILLRSQDAKLFSKTLNGAVTANQKIVKCRTLDILLNISAPNDRKRMKLPPIDSSRWGDSNELCFIFLRSLAHVILDQSYLR
jgi:hypothetical protein